MQRIVTSTLFSVLMVLSNFAKAQSAETPSGDEQVEAREAFQRGSEAAAEERWAESERWFRRSYELSGVSSALFNQAVALRALGRHREARDAFRRLLEGDEIGGAVRDTAAQLMQQSAARVSTLRVEGLEDGVEHEIQLDGEPRSDDGSRPLLIETDEGTHSVLVVRGGYEPFTWTGSAAPGATQAVSVQLQALPEQTVVVRETVPRGPSIFEEPAFWVVLGLVAALTVTGVAVGVAFSDAQLQPSSAVRFDL